MIGVYGANGFVGRHLVRRLAGRGVPVRAVSRRFDPSFSQDLSETVDFVEADLRHQIDIASSLKGIDAVVQLVSSSSPGMGNDYTIADIQDNVIPQVEFLHACIQAGVRRYVYISSGGTVYGPDAPVPTRETSPLNPINSHGLTKLVVEKYIQMYGFVEGLEYVILRVANLFGPGQEFKKGQGIFPMLLDSWRRDRPVTVLGDGEARRDYVYIDDVIRAIEASLELDGAPQSVLNIGSGETRSVNEVISALEAATGYSFDCEYTSPRKTDVGVSHLDISLAGDVLSWRPETAFDAGVEATVRDGDFRHPL